MSNVHVHRIMMSMYVLCSSSHDVFVVVVVVFLLQWLKCDQCDFETLKDGKLTVHKNSHKYPLGVDCPVCNKNVANPR